VNDQRGGSGGHSETHDFLAHARRPSTTVQSAMPSATRSFSHQAPHSVLAARPANTAIARYAYSKFCVSSPAVAEDPSRRFASRRSVDDLHLN
jgi:hypothetical protein